MNQRYHKAHGKTTQDPETTLGTIKQPLALKSTKHHAYWITPQRKLNPQKSKRNFSKEVVPRRKSYPKDFVPRRGNIIKHSEEVVSWRRLTIRHPKEVVPQREIPIKHSKEVIPWKRITIRHPKEVVPRRGTTPKKREKKTPKMSYLRGELQ